MKNSKKKYMVVASIVIAIALAVMGAYMYTVNSANIKEAGKIDALIDAIGYAKNDVEEIDSTEIADNNYAASIMLDSEKTIMKARQAYDAASSKVQKKVTKYEILTEAEKQLAEMKAEIDSVEKAIDDIGYAEDADTDMENGSVQGITLDSEKAIVNARQAYDKLRSDLRSSVDNIAILEKAEKALDMIKTVTDVIDRIDALGEITLDSETSVSEVRTSYDALSDEEKTLVYNLDILTTAETTISDLKKAEEERVAAEAAAAEKKKAEEEAAKKAASTASSTSTPTASGTPAPAPAPSTPTVSNPAADPSYLTYIHNTGTSYDLSALNAFIRSDLCVRAYDSNKGVFSYSAYDSVFGYKCYDFALSCQEDVELAVSVLKQAGY